MRVLVFLFIVFLQSFSFAQSMERYPFTDPQQRAQFQGLLKQLRCLVCQNQDLAGSNAGLANDLKQIVYQRVLSKQSNQTIIHFLTDKYGDFILFNPPLKSSTWVLWFAPFLFLVIGLIIFLRVIYKREHHA